MNIELLDKYVQNILKESGWSSNRNINIDSWLETLAEEGYKVNDYACTVLKELGELHISVLGDENHLDAEMHFNPVNAASGEYDRLEIFNEASGEELFPIGECYDFIIYVSISKKVYLGDWQSLFIVGDTIEDFLDNMFNPQAQYEKIYTNDNR